MGDRELLEAAARAAGMYVLPQPWPDADGWFFGLHHGEPAMHYRLHKGRAVQGKPWMPLTDDGDALRLAVKLQLRVIAGPRKAVASTDSADVIMAEFLEPDPCAATRRAIVRAAAEIGRDGGEGHG
jgi:hypothetical protein